MKTIAAIAVLLLLAQPAQASPKQDLLKQLKSTQATIHSEVEKLESLSTTIINSKSTNWDEIYGTRTFEDRSVLTEFFVLQCDLVNMDLRLGILIDTLETK